MNELLMIVGVFVFFISVYGAVMVGGHLLEEVQQADQSPAGRPSDRNDVAAVVATTSPKEY